MKRKFPLMLDRWQIPYTLTHTEKPLSIFTIPCIYTDTNIYVARNGGRMHGEHVCPFFVKKQSNENNRLFRNRLIHTLHGLYLLEIRKPCSF